MKTRRKMWCMLLVLAFLLPQVIVGSGSSAEAAEVWNRWPENAGVFHSNAKGWWYAYTIDGEQDNYTDSGYAMNDWVKHGGKWYYFDANGYMVTGWKCLTISPEEKGGSGQKYWFYFDPEKGELKSGWLKQGSTWYYLGGSGRNDYYGQCSEIFGCSMTVGDKSIGGKTYHFDDSGKMAVNKWIRHEGYAMIKKYHWRYFDGTGAGSTGWKQINRKWYYFKKDTRYKNDPGLMVTSEYRDGYWIGADGTWTYKPKASWKKTAGGWRYVDTSGYYVKGMSVRIDGTAYLFDPDGYLIQGNTWKSQVPAGETIQEYDIEVNKDVYPTEEKKGLYFVRSFGIIRTEYLAVVETDGIFYGATIDVASSIMNPYIRDNGKVNYGYLGHDLQFDQYEGEFYEGTNYYSAKSSSEILKKISTKPDSGEVRFVSLCNVQKNSKIHFYTKDGKLAASFTWDQLKEKTYYAAML